MTNLESVEAQLSELEALESIFPNENEVVVQDHQELAVMKQFVETLGASYLPQKKLHITLNLKLESSNCLLTIECIFPATYPKLSLPEIFLRCDAMTRISQQKFNNDLAVYMQSIEVGDTCLFQIAQWATEAATEQLEKLEAGEFHSCKKAETLNSDKLATSSQSCVFSRLWIYSHHIYNKEKRKCILEWAKELDLTGFSMPGKPGVVCVEGIQDNCEDYWQRLRRQTWKRLSVVERDECVTHTEDLNDHRKFHGPFSEMDFGVHGGRDYHMDLGKFLQFLTDHDCQHMFARLFGVEGKTKQ